MCGIMPLTNPVGDDLEFRAVELNYSLSEDEFQEAQIVPRLFMLRFQMVLASFIVLSISLLVPRHSRHNSVVVLSRRYILIGGSVRARSLSGHENVPSQSEHQFGTQRFHRQGWYQGGHAEC